MNIIVTGGAGFIGGNFCHYMTKKYPEDTILCIDKLTYLRQSGNTGAHYGQAQL